MITIVEPKEAIDRLWGKQKINERETYRLMRYVLRVNCDGKELLHNVVTGQLVALDSDEKTNIDKLPISYETWMGQLIEGHYLVNDQCNEHRQVVNLREILRRVDETQSKSGVSNYIILPTTTCNAHCYYCYQHGIKSETMSVETANDVVKYIKKYCPDDMVWIRWFGGEPTLAVPVIDQICEGLNKNSINFISRMTTNGYLIDKGLIEKMKRDWHLKQIMISLDGSERNYNFTKSFNDTHDNPYRRVLQNVKLLLEHDIYVSLRMNFDKRNYMDFNELLKDVISSFGNNPLLEVRPHNIIPNNRFHDTDTLCEYEQWCNDKIVELNEMSRKVGLYHKEYPLPSLQYMGCIASSDKADVILPDGSLVSCPDSLDKEQVKGNIRQGITDFDRDKSWKRFCDFDKCKDCLFFPKCTVAANCEGGNFCTYFNEYLAQYKRTVIEKAQLFNDGIC